MDNFYRGFRATIYYTIDNGHPDRKYMNNKSTSIVRTYTDTYYFPVEEKRSVWYKADREAMERYIKSDLRLVAGGGYDSKHIHNIKFDIVED